MSIPYRTQQTLRRLAIAVLALLVVGVFVWGLWFLWLQRFAEESWGLPQSLVTGL